MEEIPSFSPVIGDLKLRVPALSISIEKKHRNLRLLAFPMRVLERRSRGFRFALLNLVLLIKGRLAFPNIIKKASVSNYYNFSRDRDFINQKSIEKTTHVIKEPYIAPEKKGNAEGIPKSHAGSSVISPLHHFFINLERRSLTESQSSPADGRESRHSDSSETKRQDTDGFFTAKAKEESGKTASLEEIFNSFFSVSTNENTYFTPSFIKNNIHISNRYNGSDFVKTVPRSILHGSPYFRGSAKTIAPLGRRTPFAQAIETPSHSTLAEPGMTGHEISRNATENRARAIDIIKKGPISKKVAKTKSPLNRKNPFAPELETRSPAAFGEPGIEGDFLNKETVSKRKNVLNEISKDKAGNSAPGKTREKNSFEKSMEIPEKAAELLQKSSIEKVKVFAGSLAARSISLTQISNLRPRFTKIVQHPRVHKVRESWNVSTLLNKQEFYGGSNNQLSRKLDPVHTAFSQELSSEAGHERAKDMTIEHITRKALSPGKKTVELKHARPKKGEPLGEGGEIQRSLTRETGQKENTKVREKNERETLAQRQTKVNLDNLADQVYKKLETKIRIERERRGLI